jgi:hypothetical protein
LRADYLHDDVFRLCMVAILTSLGSVASVASSL